MVPFFDKCVDTIWKVLAQDRLVSIGILPSVNSIKQNRAVKQEIRVYSRTTRLTNNQRENHQKSHHSHKGRENEDKSVVAIVKTVPTGTIHSVCATSSEYPGKERTIAWKNTSQNSSSAKSLRCEIWGPVPWRDARSKAWNLAKNIYKLKRKTRLHCILLARGGMGTPGCVNERAGGKRVCGRFRSEYAYGQ